MLYEVAIELVGPTFTEAEATAVLDRLAEHSPAIVLGSAHSTVICSVVAESLLAAVAVVATAAIDATGREPLTLEATPQGESGAGLTDGSVAEDLAGMADLLGLSPDQVSRLIAQGKLLPPPSV